MFISGSLPVRRGEPMNNQTIIYIVVILVVLALAVTMQDYGGDK